MVEEEKQVKPRRRRRTKAEIEAEKELKVQSKRINTKLSKEEKVQEDTAQSEDVKLEPVKSVKHLSKKDSSKSKQNDKSAVQANQFPKKTFVGNMTVYEAPFDGSYAKKLFGAFTSICLVNGFVQVEYVKHGFGLVKGYVKPESFNK